MCSCGRKHSMALDANGQIWTFISWGRPFRLVTPALDKSSPSETPVQAECGWSYSAALTASGDVFVWWPFGDSVQQVVATTNVRMDQEGDKRAHATADGAIPCVTWDLHHDPRRLPAIPRLPDLPRPSRAYGEDERQETKLVKIAGMDNFLVGLTNKGHVLKFGDLSNELSLEQGRWEYVSSILRQEEMNSRILANMTFTHACLRRSSRFLARQGRSAYIRRSLKGSEKKEKRSQMLWPHRWTSKSLMCAQNSTHCTYIYFFSHTFDLALRTCL